LSWSQSLIRISTYEVEVLQKRLAEIERRRAAAEIRIAVLDAEAEGETAQARTCLDAARAHPAYLAAWRRRRATAETDLDLIGREADGARDALASAFEELKKFEHVAELAALARRKETARRETAALDDLALRRRAAG
jgi:flagellar protein FliJ